MNLADWIGFIGVSLLLSAFFMNLRGLIQKESLNYLLLNIGGAGLACFASILLNYIPFIILEACWTLVSLHELIRYLKLY